VSAAVINYVMRTKSAVVIHDAQKPQSVIPGLNQEEYVRTRGVKSILCIPLLAGGIESPELMGVLYVENNGATHTFVERVQEPLEIICLSAAGRLELSRKAVTDLLTNVYNHDYMQGILQKELSNAKRTGREVSLIMIDIDHFKKFNDNHGHQAGDVVLAAVAQLIKASTRQSDVVARYGGEEMAVVLPDTDQRMAMEVADRIRRTIAETVVPFEEKELNVTVSMGVASFGGHVSDPKALVKAADAALYQSKDAGRNRVTAAGAATAIRD
jgi:diguanylate cyclase (GGDEF)-like protein